METCCKIGYNGYNVFKETIEFVRGKLLWLYFNLFILFVSFMEFSQTFLFFSLFLFFSFDGFFVSL